MSRLASILLATTLAAGVAVAAEKAPPTTPTSGPDDRISCPAPSRAVVDPAAPFAPSSALEAFAELDRRARQGCAPKTELRIWHDLRQRLFPFDREPAVGARRAAWEEALSMPIVEPRGDDWTSIGPANVGGRMRALLIDPRDENVLYAAGADGGVWKTTDAGTTWTALTDHLGSLSSGALAFDPTDPDTIYYGTGEAGYGNLDALEGAGVYRSTDAGATWAAAGSAFSNGVAKIAVLATTPATVIVAAHGYQGGGIYRSTDAGAHWKRIKTGAATAAIGFPNDPNRALAALGKISGSGNNGVYLSTDAGATFNEVGNAGVTFSGCGRVELAGAPSDANVVYAACQEGSDSKGVWKSTDGGENWTGLPKAPNYCGEAANGAYLGQCWYDNVLLVDPRDPQVLYLGGIDVYESDNGGTSFKSISNYYQNYSGLHPDQHALAMGPSGTLWVGNDGGVWRRPEGSTSFQDMSKGLVTSQFYGFAEHPTNRFPVIGGLQDNGTQRHTGNESNNYTSVMGADGGFTAVDDGNPTIWIASIYYLEMHKSTNTGASFSRSQCTNGIPSNEVGLGGCGQSSTCKTLFIAPFVSDPVQGNRFLAGTDKVYYSDNDCTSWIKASDSLSGSVSALAFSPADDEIWWAGTSAGKIYVNRGFLAGGTWEDVTSSPLPYRYLTRIAPDPVDPETAYVTYSGTERGHVFRTTDGGATWTNLTGNLPDVPTNGIVIDPDSPNRIWVGTDIGVYFTDDGTSWARYGTDLPMVRVDEIRFQKTLRLVRAASHGRGIWEVSADLAVALPPVAAFEHSPATAKTGEPVSFHDLSSGGPTSWAWSFGDGATSTEPSPTHTYTTAGTMTVSLTVTNGAGSSTTSSSLVVENASTVTYSPALAVPGQARAEGVGGAFFKTSLWITNPSSADSRLRLRFVPASGSGDGGGSSTADVTVGPHQSKAYHDVLAEAFGASSSTSGVIVAELAAGDAIPLVSARTFNDSPDGTYGQYIPAVPVATGKRAATSEAWIDGLEGNDAARSNLGVVNLGASSITATISLRDGSGATVGNDQAVTVPASSVVQINKVNEAGGAGALSPFSVRVTATGDFFAYASKLDNTTSDPIFVPAGLAAVSTQWIDGVARAAGSGGTFFRSSLSLTNRSTSPATVALSFTPRGESAATGDASVTLAGGESRRWADLVDELFTLDGVAGRLAISSDVPLVAWSRTYNDLGAGNGSFGQFIAGFSSYDLIGTGGAILQGLSEGDATRTNMGLVDVGPNDVSVTLTVWRSDGTQAGQKSYTVASGQSLFLFRVLSDILGGASISDAYVVVEPSTADSIYAWASFVDNASTDQTFVRPLAIP